MSDTPCPQCRATCKATSERCKKRAIRGSVVCRFHGGSAPQVRAKAQVRILQAELVKAAEDDPAMSDATPAEMLLHAAHSAGRVVLLLQKQAAGGSLDPVYLDTIGTWLDRLSTLTKTVVASNADELVIAQQVRIAEGQARQLAVVMNQVLNGLGLTPDQHALVPSLLGSALASLGLIPKPSASVQAPNSGEGSLALPSAIGGRHA